MTVRFAGTRSKEGELVIVMTNQDLTAAQILNTYKKRWSIEELFRKLKSSGFNWENTHMKQTQRLITLLIVLGMAALLVYLSGQTAKIPFKKTIGYLAKSVFKQGITLLQRAIAKSLAQALEWIAQLLESAKIIIFLKSDG